MALKSFREDPRRARFEAAVAVKPIPSVAKPTVKPTEEPKVLKPVVKKVEKFDAI